MHVYNGLIRRMKVRLNSLEDHVKLKFIVFNLNSSFSMMSCKFLLVCSNIDSYFASIRLRRIHRPGKPLALTIIGGPIKRFNFTRRVCLLLST